jgi:hypothetical protein
MTDEAPNTEPQENAAAAEERPPLPPASFGELIFTLRFQAEMHLGMLPIGGEGEEKPPVDLPAAQHYIDLLGILSQKTKGNLALEEERYLENTLTELRFRFVQAADAGHTQ